MRHLLFYFIVYVFVIGIWSFIKVKKYFSISNSMDMIGATKLIYMNWYSLFAFYLGIQLQSFLFSLFYSYCIFICHCYSKDYDMSDVFSELRSWDSQNICDRLWRRAFHFVLGIFLVLSLARLTFLTFRKFVVKTKKLRGFKTILFLLLYKDERFSTSFIIEIMMFVIIEYTSVI